MDRQTRQSRSIKIQPAILRQAHIRAIESGKKLGQWLEDAIMEKLAREKGEDRSQNREDSNRRFS